MKICKYLKMPTYFLSLFFTMLITITVVSTTAYAETKMVEVYTKFSDQQLIDIAKKRYPIVELDGQGKIRITNELGQKVVIFNHSDTGYLSFKMSWGANNNISLKSVNKWNTTKRFLTAYIDAVGNLILHDDLDIEEGISKADLLNVLSRTFMEGYLFSSDMPKEQ